MTKFGVPDGRKYVSVLSLCNEKIDGQGALCYIRKENDFISD